MGASQLLIDRILEKASNEVDLVAKDDFMKYLNEVEPFLDEWLIAKCGIVGEAYALNINDLIRYQDLVAKQKLRVEELIAPKIREPGYDFSEIRKQVQAIYDGYTPEGFTLTETIRLHSSVSSHDSSVRDCRSDAIGDHQRLWAQNNN